MRKTTIFLILSTLLLSLFLFLVAKPQAYINAFSDNLNHGNYDAIITGPISASQYNLLESQPDIVQLSPAFVIRAKVINKTETEISQIFFADDPNQFSKSSNYNKQLLLEGSFENQHSVISYDLAKNLNLQIGDEFQIEIAGNIYNSTVSGIFKKAQGVSRLLLQIEN
jgi:ABC-type lipoprotein release transport system permease subunit